MKRYKIIQHRRNGSYSRTSMELKKESEIKPCTYSQRIFDKDTEHTLDKGVFSMNGSDKTGTQCRIKLDPYLLRYTIPTFFRLMSHVISIFINITLINSTKPQTHGSNH